MGCRWLFHSGALIGGLDGVRITWGWSPGTGLAGIIRTHDTTHAGRYDHASCRSVQPHRLASTATPSFWRARVEAVSGVWLRDLAPRVGCGHGVGINAENELRPRWDEGLFRSA